MKAFTHGNEKKLRQDLIQAHNGEAKNVFSKKSSENKLKKGIEIRRRLDFFSSSSFVVTSLDVDDGATQTRKLQLIHD